MEEYVVMKGENEGGGGEVESKGVLVGLSTLLHTIQDVYTLFKLQKDKMGGIGKTGNVD